MCIRDRFQAVHNQFVASALATKKLHEIDPDAKMGNMLCRLENYAEYVIKFFGLPTFYYLC